ncbi:MAG TPA: class I SAM-dependent methyltransferase [Steroidobacteraceae bacterium]|nr:class I SAM-dependent methyltransferase [Steroidobacteraceae bacterium]
MNDDLPGRTAHGVAMSRAAHQIFDLPRVFEDPAALTILGSKTTGAIRAAERRFNNRYARYLRAFLVARSRLAEEALTEAVARGVRQYVLLGAGLDTFAYRNPHAAGGLRVFEVDHPATQEWKRQLVSHARLKSQGSLIYVPVNFEREQLADRLIANGFQRDEPAFFSWLGVTMYLTQDAILQTLRFVAQPMVSRSGIVFDYLTLPPPWDLLRRWGLKVLKRRIAAAGEPWRTFFEPAALHADLTRLGFATIRDFGPDEINARFFDNAGARLRVGGIGRVVLARI